MRPFFKDESFNFQTEIALGATYHRAADVGEVLSSVERIRNGHAQSWPAPCMANTSETIRPRFRLLAYSLMMVALTG